MNEGKAFVLPHMTVEGQEKLLEITEKLKEKCKNNTKKYNREYNKQTVLYTLKTIDKNITIENINKMHPNDYVILFNTIWEKGQELKSDDSDFQIQE